MYWVSDWNRSHVGLSEKEPKYGRIKKLRDIRNLLSISKILVWITFVIMIGSNFSSLTRQLQLVASTSVLINVFQ